VVFKNYVYKIDKASMICFRKSKIRLWTLNADMRSMEKRALFYKEVEELTSNAYTFFISNRKKGNINVTVLQKHNIENMKMKT